MVGITRAKDIVMRSRRLGGRQAYEWGVATECVADRELEAATDALVEELRSLPPLAQRTAKKLLNDIEDAPLSLAIELEGQCYGRLRSSEGFPRRGRSLRCEAQAKLSRKMMAGEVVSGR
jgi:2-oxoglutaroyl-CoA hydrolase